jgi:ketosteroid isomerase-like protein
MRRGSRRPTNRRAAVWWAGVAAVTVAALAAAPLTATPESDRAEVAKLDSEFQAAVKRNDAATMARILHESMVLVLGDGTLNTRDEQLREARDWLITYEIQDEDPGTQAVRVHGDTAIVTARLRIKGTRQGVPFERRLWFSDVYVRTAAGWRYFFGQASLRLPDSPNSQSRAER